MCGIVRNSRAIFSDSLFPKLWLDSEVSVLLSLITNRIDQSYNVDMHMLFEVCDSHPAEMPILITTNLMAFKCVFHIGPYGFQNVAG